MKRRLIMKKILSLVLVLTLVLGMALSLASCSKTLSGTYENAGLGITYEFSGKNVTMTSQNLSSAILGSNAKTVKEGTYEIVEAEDGSFDITFNWGGDDIATFDFSEIEVDGEKSIKIGLVTYTKK